MVKVAAIILAGGNSERFGKPKTFLAYDNSTTFLERILNVYNEFGCKEITLVINKDHSDLFCCTYPEAFRSRIRVIYNSRPELGRFYSLQLGTAAVCETCYCFIQNIDNPFTDISTLQILYDNRRDDSYVSPVYLNRGGHPILLSAPIIECIKQETDIQHSLKKFLGSFEKISVEVDNEKVLANINTPADYDLYFNKAS